MKIRVKPQNIVSSTNFIKKNITFEHLNNLNIKHVGDLLQRTIYGGIFAVTVILGIVIHPIVFILVFLGITLLSVYEFYKLIAPHSTPQIKNGMLASALLFLGCFFQAYLSFNLILVLFILVAVAIPIYEMFRIKKAPINNIASTIQGIVYVALPFSLLNFIVFPFGNQEYHWEILLGVVLLIWINDTGAYLFGSNFGKHRLFERISPKKSWEGSIGGAVTAVLSSVFIAMYANSLTFFEWIVISILVVVFGSLGDLVESLFKRSLNIKDSGNLIPGHGGLLDRFDALLLATPMVFAFLQIIKEYFR